MPTDPFTPGELRLLLTVLGPEYLWGVARDFSPSDPVMGAFDAAVETRGVVRSILRRVYRRSIRNYGKEAARRELRAALRALGTWPSTPPVFEVDTPWRAQAGAIHKAGPWAIPGSITVPVDSEWRRNDFAPALAFSISKIFLADPDLNRCFLAGKTYRCAPHPITACEYVELAPDEIRPLVWRVPKMLSDAVLDRRSALRRLVRTHKHPLEPYGVALVTRWNEAGYMRPPATIQISDFGGEWILDGSPALPPGNGIPWAFGIGAVDSSAMTVKIVIHPDHRAIDPRHIAIVHRRLATQFRSTMWEISKV